MAPTAKKGGGGGSGGSSICSSSSDKNTTNASKTKTKCKFALFPAKLHYAITNLVANDDSLDGIVVWEPDGRSFTVLDKDRLETEILSKLFRQSKFASFVRQLCNYGFERIGSATYQHDQFHRDHPEWADDLQSIKYLELQAEEEKAKKEKEAEEAKEREREEREREKEERKREKKLSAVEISSPSPPSLSSYDAVLGRPITLENSSRLVSDAALSSYAYGGGVGASTARHPAAVRDAPERRTHFLPLLSSWAVYREDSPEFGPTDPYAGRHPPAPAARSQTMHHIPYPYRYGPPVHYMRHDPVGMYDHHGDFVDDDYFYTPRHMMMRNRARSEREMAIRYDEDRRMMEYPIERPARGAAEASSVQRFYRFYR